MSERLRPVPLQELRLLGTGRLWAIDQHLDELDSLSPIQGQLEVLHHGTVLEVRATVATSVALRCDRCLETYAQPLVSSSEEWIALGDPNAESEQVLELDPEDLSETLDPSSNFDPCRWLFEQLSLQLPLRNHCGADCQGPEGLLSPGSALGIDPRWARLQHLSPP